MVELATLDWDYCIPIHCLNDWAMARYSDFFLRQVWPTRNPVRMRDGAQKRLKMVDQRDLTMEFDFKCTFDILAISECHSNALDFFTFIVKSENDIESVKIHNFDLHHDMWSIGDKINASNWLTAFLLYLTNLEKVKEVEVIWYLPTWAEREGYSPECFAFERQKERLENEKITINHSTIVPSLHAKGLHLCRSGAWVPPTLDHKFIEFANILRNETVAFKYDESIDPMEPRFDEGEYNSILDAFSETISKLKSEA